MSVNAITLTWQACEPPRPRLRSEQLRTIEERAGSLWAVPAAELPLRVEPYRFTRLQRKFFPDLRPRLFCIPPSSIDIIQCEAHPLALYAVAEEVIAAALELGCPAGLTVADIPQRYAAARQWLRECDDTDYVDFALDAAGYKWTQQTLTRGKGARQNFIYVLRGLNWHEQREAIAARKRVALERAR